MFFQFSHKSINRQFISLCFLVLYFNEVWRCFEGCSWLYWGDLIESVTFIVLPIIFCFNQYYTRYEKCSSGFIFQVINIIIVSNYCTRVNVKHSRVWLKYSLILLSIKSNLKDYFFRSYFEEKIIFLNNMSTNSGKKKTLIVMLDNS